MGGNPQPLVGTCCRARSERGSNGKSVESDGPGFESRVYPLTAAGLEQAMTSPEPQLPHLCNGITVIWKDQKRRRSAACKQLCKPKVSLGQRLSSSHVCVDLLGCYFLRNGCRRLLSPM